MTALKKKPKNTAAKSNQSAKLPLRAMRAAVKGKRTLASKPRPKAKGRSEKIAAKPPVTIPELPAHVAAVVRALDGKKAQDIRVIEMSQISSVADYLVVASGTSEPHLRALRITVEQSLDELRVASRTESQKESGWTVVDAFDMLVHIFLESTRRNYALEALWKDGLDIPAQEILRG